MKIIFLLFVVLSEGFVFVCACFKGKDMYLVLENNMLNLVDPMDRSVLHSQPIASIRVWGVGRDNGRLVTPVTTTSLFIPAVKYLLGILKMLALALRAMSE